MLYTLHELAKNPDIQMKLSDEVARVVGSSSVVTEEQVQHLHYLKGCIKESLRYFVNPCTHVCLYISAPLLHTCCFLYRLYPSGNILRNLPHGITLCGYQIPAEVCVHMQ